MSKASTTPASFSKAMFSTKRLLGGLSPERFLAEYWQKKPLLVRQALPGFGTWLGPDELRRLACDGDAESRLVRNRRGRWELQHGPFELADLHALPAKGWSLLVSGVNHFLLEGDALLNAFNFVPRARLDDLMVSLAPNGGGVGPHFDSYDVFLIQGLGRRRWEISDQTDLSLVPDAPLRILRNFQATQSWELEAGDMLYLPPKYAHNGVAVGECMTWSVGFRAPSRQELVGQFFAQLQEQLQGKTNAPLKAGLYADPGLKRPRNPAALPADMLAWTEQAIRQATWDKGDIADFLGRYLSEPKAHVFFDPPVRPMSRARFANTVRNKGLHLDPRSQLLFHGKQFYINGERIEVSRDLSKTLRMLANQRQLAACDCPDHLLDILYDWYANGFVVP